MKLCCLDQSTKITGYSIWDDGKLVDYGVIDTSSERDLQKRMGDMYSQIKRLFYKYSPDFVFLEETQFQSNQKVYRTLAQLQGLIFAAAYDCDIGYMVVEPLMWKSFAGIKSRKRDEQKEESIRLVKEKYDIDCPTDDLADSICIGYWAINNIE